MNDIKKIAGMMTFWASLPIIIAVIIYFLSQIITDPKSPIMKILVILVLLSIPNIFIQAYLLDRKYRKDEKVQENLKEMNRMSNIIIKFGISLIIIQLVVFFILRLLGISNMQNEYMIMSAVFVVLAIIFLYIYEKSKFKK